MKEFAEYISDGIVQCKIVRKDSGKIDIVAIYANKQSEAITGRPVEEILNKGMTEVYPVIVDSIFNWPQILSEAAMTSDHKIIEQYVTGIEKYVRFSIFGFKDDTFYLAMQDLTEQKQAKKLQLEKNREIKFLENELKSRANVDPLTKLYNFQFINECIKSSVTNYKEEGINFCLITIDIDDFKKINLLFGMQKADIMLQDVAKILSSNARKIDVVGRYGNDKFTIILNNVDLDIAKIMMERIKMEIENYSLNYESKLSICCSIVEYEGETIEQFIERSESLLKKAQSIGKGIILS
ncbi:GGDEF domain-containing protein [Sedimentibacter hydroxybenzoicus DSM 7310]|uniref:GGDEF domain-containing protein n=1 Tax=Sedimentibacter hydroxybenzoicus DSM 7310 TaxID=1123245 RepID=A0A974BHF6_SEDHY|nr:GGDEF domain-containing protein [Sedimentibacter hydroxybenzoicus]NYB73230.1 GGDEF domain-containing protein [Sedimentibacter hydroxybenzoicus DSM 7310]